MKLLRVIFLSLTLLGCASAGPPSPDLTAPVAAGRLAPVVAPAFTPQPARDFIARNPDYIRLIRARRSDKPLDGGAETLALLDRVNREGNALIKWTDDRVTWGVPDIWDFPCESNHQLYDDCDSFALWKMRRLIELGVSSTPLLLTLGQVENGGGHAVLVVRTTTGDYVLDNRFTEVKTMAEIVALNYNLMWRVASGDRMDRWVMLRRTRPDILGTLTIGPPQTFGPPLCIPKEIK